MGTHRFAFFPHPRPARRGLLIYTTVREDVERVRVCFSGEIDLASSDLIDVAIGDALRLHRPRHVDLDLAEVRFIDASGIRALLRCHERTVEAGCRLAVTNPQPLVYRIMEITGVLVKLAVSPGHGP
jgi:anti-anti-sigma factor